MRNLCKMSGASPNMTKGCKPIQIQQQITIGVHELGRPETNRGPIRFGRSLGLKLDPINKWAWLRLSSIKAEFQPE